MRKLVRDMNGRIHHERDELRGLTDFRVRFPMAESRRDAGLGDRAEEALT